MLMMVMIVKAAQKWILWTVTMKLMMMMTCVYGNVDEGVVDEGAVEGILVRTGSKRNAPTSTENGPKHLGKAIFQ
jgi:hypothetical protein